MKLMRKTKNRIAVVSALAIVGIVGYYLGSPLFINRTVNEAPPLQIEIERPAMEEPGRDVPAQPVVEEREDALLFSGTFIDGDDFHRASGDAIIIRGQEGRSFLRFEKFEVTNGPDLFVYLSKSKNPPEGFVDLGSLKGNIGDQNYEIASDVDLSEFDTVLIWCRAFSVLFGSAELR